MRVRWIAFAMILLVALTVGVSTSEKGSALRVRERPRLEFPVEARVWSSVARQWGGLVSSLIWIRVVFDYADAVARGEESSSILSGVVLSSAFDPTWEQPVLFGSLVTPKCPSDSLYAPYKKMLDTALARIEDPWKIRVFVAMHMKTCGTSESDLRELVLPLSSCLRCPPWVRSFPTTILGEVLARPEKVTLLAEAWMFAISSDERERLERRMAGLMGPWSQKAPFDSSTILATRRLLLLHKHGNPSQRVSAMQVLQEGTSETPSSRVLEVFRNLGKRD